MFSLAPDQALFQSTWQIVLPKDQSAAKSKDIDSEADGSFSDQTQDVAHAEAADAEMQEDGRRGR